MAKTIKGFDDMISLIAMFVFVVVAVEAFTTITLSDWIVSVALILAGAGLMLEGQITSFAQWRKNGIQKIEYVYLFTIGAGLVTVIGGILTMPVISIASQQLQGIIGGVAIISAIFIALQRWVFN